VTINPTRGYNSPGCHSTLAVGRPPKGVLRYYASFSYQAGSWSKKRRVVDFDRRLKLEFHGSKVTSDAGLLPYRELDDAVGLTEIAGDVLTDTRRGKNGRHGLVGQFRQSVFGRLGGYDDVNDADRLSLDPVMRWIVRCRPFPLVRHGGDGHAHGRSIARKARSTRPGSGRWPEPPSRSAPSDWPRQPVS